MDFAQGPLARICLWIPSCFVMLTRMVSGCWCEVISVVLGVRRRSGVEVGDKACSPAHSRGLLSPAIAWRLACGPSSILIALHRHSGVHDGYMIAYGAVERQDVDREIFQKADVLLIPTPPVLRGHEVKGTEPILIELYRH